MGASSAATRAALKAGATNRRSRVWSGGSTLSTWRENAGPGSPSVGILVNSVDLMLGLQIGEGFGILGLIFTLAAIYPALALYAKRWHDRGKSGWWTLIILIPLVGPIWLLIELGALEGTRGPNNYGPDPLA
jgi:hypothetical protein